MFERYTEKARRTIFFSRYEASQFGSPYIESEHLLLGLLREDEDLANAFLRSHGGIESIRKQAERQTPVREKVSNSIDLPLSNECKHILAYSVKEADKLSHKYISTGHLFLGVLREQHCLAAKLLRERGIALETARDQIGSNSSEQLGPIDRPASLRDISPTDLCTTRPPRHSFLNCVPVRGFSSRPGCL